METQTITINDIYHYNTCNHWDYRYNGELYKCEEQIPDDYDVQREKVNTKNWIHLKEHKVISIDKSNFKWIVDAANIGQHTAKVSKLHQEEFNELISMDTSDIFNGEKYFVRINNVSCKYGMNGLKPYTNFKSIIESMLTSIPSHRGISSNMKELNIYLIPWVTISNFNEFRVFVCENRITAISQQDCYNVNTLDVETIQKYAETLCKYIQEKLIPEFRTIKNYSIDIAILEDGSCYFIELNSFGCCYSAGSSLFHWIDDWKILYGKHGKIVLRYVSQ